jgi:hypothetical protein
MALCLIDGDITHRLLELVSHLACSSVPNKVLAKFLRDFEEFGSIRHVALLKTFRVRLLVDERLFNQLDGPELP